MFEYPNEYNLKLTWKQNELFSFYVLLIISIQRGQFAKSKCAKRRRMGQIYFVQECLKYCHVFQRAICQISNFQY